VIAASYVRKPLRDVRYFARYRGLTLSRAKRTWSGQSISVAFDPGCVKTTLNDMILL
jgi:hypothetical protein